MLDIKKVELQRSFSRNDVLNIFPDSKVPNHDFLIELSEAGRFKNAVLDMEGSDDDNCGPGSRFVSSVLPDNGRGFSTYSVVLSHPEDMAVIGYYTFTARSGDTRPWQNTSKPFTLEMTIDMVFIDDRYRGFGYSNVLAASAKQLLSTYASKHLKGVVDPDAVELVFEYDPISDLGGVFCLKVELALYEVWDEEPDLSADSPAP